jgi:nifR3 family TIM-barrel protein
LGGLREQLKGIAANLFHIMAFSIGKVGMKNQLVLAPMYRVTDLPFRLLCREQGASLCYSEMVNSEALIRNNKAAGHLAQTCLEDRPLAMQVFGARVESMKKAAEVLLREKQFDFLDLNLGCPSDNVINQGAGSALLKRPKRIAEIIKTWLDLDAVVTAKIRTAPNLLHTIRLAKQVEKAGASAIAVHARTVKQKNKGLVDLVAIKRVKKAVGIPVIGNGGVNDRFSFERMLSKTGCDAVMLGTAAIGNPGVFAEILGKKPLPREKAFLKYFELYRKHEIGYFGRLKTQAVKFFAGNKGLVLKVQSAKDFSELEEIILGNKPEKK